MQSQGSYMVKADNQFDAESSNASAMFVRGGDDKFMDESSAGGSVIIRGG